MQVVRVFIFGLGAAALFGVLPAAGPSGSSFSGVGRSIDGDSLYVGDREVRLFGIDAPEYHQSCKRGGQPWACGVEAAKQLSSLVSGRQVRCDQVDIDEHGRTVARCSVGRVDVNTTMVATGYAIAYRHYSMEYVGAEDHARVNKRGIWAGSFEMPREFRQDEDAQPEVQRSASRHAPSSNARPTVVTRSGCNIKGNRGAHGWIYHLPGMPYYEQTQAEEMFCTEAEAQAAGYRRAHAH